MKVIISILLSLAIFFTLVWWNQKVINDASDELIKHVVSIEKAVYDDNWTLAEQKTEETKKVWTRHKKTWLILMDHQVIDEIDICIYNLDQMIKSREKSGALENISELRFYIQDATDKERLELGNIL